MAAGVAIHRCRRKRRREKESQAQLPENALGLALDRLPANSTFNINVHGPVYLMGQNGRITGAAIAGRARYEIAGKSGYISSSGVREIED